MSAGCAGSRSPPSISPQRQLPALPPPLLVLSPTLLRADPGSVVRPWGTLWNAGAGTGVPCLQGTLVPSRVDFRGVTSSEGPCVALAGPQFPVAGRGTQAGPVPSPIWANTGPQPQLSRCFLFLLPVTHFHPGPSLALLSAGPTACPGVPLPAM